MHNGERRHPPQQPAVTTSEYLQTSRSLRYHYRAPYWSNAVLIMPLETRTCVSYCTSDLKSCPVDADADADALRKAGAQHQLLGWLRVARPGSHCLRLHTLHHGVCIHSHSSHCFTQRDVYERAHVVGAQSLGFVAEEPPSQSTQPPHRRCGGR